MELGCERCQKPFDSATMRGYCDACVQWYKEGSKVIAAHHNPSPNVHLVGKFADTKDCPSSVHDPVSGKNVCGLCGSDEIEAGYGLGTGYGMGCYNFCFACSSFLDFCEDSGE